MSKDWGEADDWSEVPEHAAALAEYIVTPIGDRQYSTRAELAKAFNVSARKLYGMSKTQIFQRYLKDCEGMAGLSRDDRVEQAKRVLFEKATSGDGDVKALSDYLRMEGEFAPEKHEVVHTDVREMTTDAIQKELDRIIETETEETA